MLKLKAISFVCEIFIYKLQKNRMEIIFRSSATIASSQSLSLGNSLTHPTIFSSKVFLWNQFQVKRTVNRVYCLQPSEESRPGNFSSDNCCSKNEDLRLNKKLLLSQFDFSGLKPERIHSLVPAFTRSVIVGIMVVMALGCTVTKAPSWALSQENLLFLEAWRTLDRAYVDKTFNGQSWFRYRENALRKEPMNTREETYAAIKKMVATLDDPFTRFLEPQKFKSLRSGTRNSLTGVGISIGYPSGNDKSNPGLVVVSAAPGGPAYKAGVLSGDVLLAIDDTSTESMEIYDAAQRLQGPEGSEVDLVLRHGSETRHLSLIRERVSLNPVKSRICRTPGMGDDGPLIGYIKLTSFNQNASGAMREAINTLRANNVNSFVLDLRDNSGGLFPEGVEIAKIWLDKGVIVYICDSKGVRDIYDTDGSNGIATSEPLVVLVNKGTASASEILAGALKDNKRAVLYGEATYGKGKIQSVFEMSDGSGLAVTVARYETPSHSDIDKVGISPDRPLPSSFPKDESNFCGCLQDVASACFLDRTELFSR